MKVDDWSARHAPAVDSQLPPAWRLARPETVSVEMFTEVQLLRRAKDQAGLSAARPGAVRLLHAADGGHAAREPGLLPLRRPNLGLSHGAHEQLLSNQDSQRTHRYRKNQPKHSSGGLPHEVAPARDEISMFTATPRPIRVVDDHPIVGASKNRKIHLFEL